MYERGLRLHENARSQNRAVVNGSWVRAQRITRVRRYLMSSTLTIVVEPHNTPQCQVSRRLHMYNVRYGLRSKAAVEAEQKLPTRLRYRTSPINTSPWRPDASCILIPQDMSVLLRPFTWFYREFGLVSIQDTGRNAYLIILARACRMFAYGTNSLILGIISHYQLSNELY